MTSKEMYRRLSSISDDDVVRVIRLIEQGYGASGIQFETNLTIAQINAIFQLKETK